MKRLCSTLVIALFCAFCSVAAFASDSPILATPMEETSACQDADADPLGQDLAAKRVCKNKNCQADSCPSGTATQNGSCRCNSSCKCKGSIKCYNSLGVLIATKKCKGECKWEKATPQPIESLVEAARTEAPATPAN
ncbi:hypothetical protein ABI59_17790 [Acidobacteria bacterium Mor1]|nr:hypothetical protein ABI59_17790 [Acidobacteria bacterium Mor1]